jgi:hypothetical protein
MPVSQIPANAESSQTSQNEFQDFFDIGFFETTVEHRKAKNSPFWLRPADHATSLPTRLGDRSGQIDHRARRDAVATVLGRVGLRQ